MEPKTSLQAILNLIDYNYEKEKITIEFSLKLKLNQRLGDDYKEYIFNRLHSKMLRAKKIAHNFYPDIGMLKAYVKLDHDMPPFFYGIL